MSAHPTVDHNDVARCAHLLLDLRGVTCGTHAENLVRAVRTVSHDRAGSTPARSFAYRLFYS